MLDEKGIRDMLFAQADIFKKHMREKNYLKAALCVDWAQMTALSIGLEEQEMYEIFGTRQTEEPIIGLINEAEYLKACDWCTMHGYEHSRRTYQNVMEMIKK